MASPKRIVIVGGGFSGITTAINLVRSETFRESLVTIVNNTPDLGCGLAYRYHDENLLLNVPIGNMSAIADEPNHFLNFCREIDPSLSAASFVSRGLYGHYLKETLEAFKSKYPGKIQTVIQEVTSIAPAVESAGWKVYFAGGEYLIADHCVLATGHQRVRRPSILSEIPDKVIDAWDYNAMIKLPVSESVAVIGSGLTAVDAALLLTRGDSRRSVLLISRHGLLPRSHRAFTTDPKPRGFPEYLSEVTLTIRARFREFRRHLDDRLAKGEDWREVFNELRAHTPRLWHELPQFEQARFLRHLQSFWDVHRHRLAPASANRLNWLIAHGRVRVVSGRVLSVAYSESELEISIWHRGGKRLETIRASALVNCAGLDTDLRSTPSGLLRQLLATGLIHPDSHRLGILVGADNQVLDALNRPIPGLWYIGPFLKANFWEATAVPELREHAQRLAARLTESLRSMNQKHLLIGHL